MDSLIKYSGNPPVDQFKPRESGVNPALAETREQMNELQDRFSQEVEKFFSAIDQVVSGLVDFNGSIIQTIRGISLEQILQLQTAKGYSSKFTDCILAGNNKWFYFSNHTVEFVVDADGTMDCEIKIGSGKVSLRVNNRLYSEYDKFAPKKVVRSGKYDNLKIKITPVEDRYASTRIDLFADVPVLLEVTDTRVTSPLVYREIDVDGTVQLLLSQDVSLRVEQGKSGLKDVRARLEFDRLPSSVEFFDGTRRLDPKDLPVIKIVDPNLEFNFFSNYPNDSKVLKVRIPMRINIFDLVAKIKNSVEQKKLPSRSLFLSK